MKKKLRNLILPLIFGLLLAGFTLYVVLDTFVLTKVYDTVPVTRAASETEKAAHTAPASDAVSLSSDASDPAPEASASENAADESASETGETGETAETETETTETTVAEPVITDTSYIDNNIQITLSQYREYNSDIYVAEVSLSDPAYLKTAFAKGQFGKNITQRTSTMAQEYGAILAVNGDYYGVQEYGYVLRNGVLYRGTAKENQEDLVIYTDGRFEIIREGEVSAESLLEAGAEQILSFGPGLVKNGEVTIVESAQTGMALEGNPRTAIARIDDLHYLFIVVDGRTDQSNGLSLYQLADFAKRLGAETAYNLDGGGSSALVFNGTMINHPATNWNVYEERSVSDIVYIGY